MLFALITGCIIGYAPSLSNELKYSDILKPSLRSNNSHKLTKHHIIQTKPSNNQLRYTALAGHLAALQADAPAVQMDTSKQQAWHTAAA